MSAVPMAFTGVMYPLNKKDPPVACYFVGNAWSPGLSVGGGPVYPQGGVPIHPIWGPPGFNPPGAGMPPGIWHDPIIPPPMPPDVEVPPPGSPPVVIGGDHATNPIVSPPFIIVNYPGIGPVMVPQPVTESAAPPAEGRRAKT